MDLATTSPNQELDVTVNGKKLDTSYLQLGSEIIELGDFEKGQQIKASFTSDSRILEMKNLNIRVIILVELSPRRKLVLK